MIPLVVSVLTVVLVTVALLDAPRASASVRVGTGAGSVTQAYLVDAQPGAPVRLIGPAGAVMGTGRVDRLGSFLIRDLTPGPGYRFEVSGRAGNTFAVRAAAAGQGTLPKSAVRGRLPLRADARRNRAGGHGAAACGQDDGRRPVPHGHRVFGISGRGARRRRGGRDRQTVEETDPLAPVPGVILGGAIGPAAGFATVIVQMRAVAVPVARSTCSIIRRSTTATTSSKPWPPSRGWPATGRAGGHLVLGIRSSRWRDPSAEPRGDRADVDHHLRPVFDRFSRWDLQYRFRQFVDHRTAEGGPAGAHWWQPYARELVRRGDARCLANQRLRLQTQDLRRLIEQNPTRTTSLLEHRSPSYWASKIAVPVLLTGTLQDEQVGP